MPDISAETKAPAPHHDSEGVMTWAAHNILDPALNAGPLGMYNTVASLAHLPEFHLAVDEAKPYSANWFVQGLSGGVGAAVPFMLAAAGTGKVFRAADGMLAGTAVGESLHPILISARAASVAGATLYGGLQKPEEGHTRFGNAVGMGLGFLAFDRGNMMSAGLPLIGKAVAYPLTGFIGGAVMSEGSSLFSHGKLAPTDQVLQSGVQGMTLNTVMPLAQEGIRRLSERSSTPTRPAGERAPDDNAAQPRSNSIDQIDMHKTGIASLDGKTDVARLSNISQEYSNWLKQNARNYPTPEEFAKLTPEEIVNRGFLHPDATPEEIALFRDQGHKPPPLPDAKVVATEVGKSVAGMQTAGKTGDIIMGEWNMEFLTGDKANYFKDAYGHIVPKHHLMFVEETNADGLAQIAKDNGYKFEISKDNSRGQAVGFLVNDRLKVLGTHSYDDVADVHNIPDLRPAFRVDLQDTTTGEKFSAVAVHLKSMRGGPEQTAPVRTEQAAKLAADLGPNFKGVIAGDWNTFLDKSHELDPLTKAGFQILNPGDSSSTQSMGGRLDGFLTKNMPGKMTGPDARPFFQNPLITRGLSDHALLTTHWVFDTPSSAMWAPVTRMMEAYNTFRSH